LTTELDIVADQVLSAKRPEDIFGLLFDIDDVSEKFREVKRIYYKLSLILHPDKNHGSKLANEAFAKLGNLYETAGATIQSGIYGAPAPILELETKKFTYSIFEPHFDFGITTGYECIIDARIPVIFNIAKLPKFNSRIDHEAKVLKILFDTSVPTATGFFSMLPGVYETVSYQENGFLRKANPFFLPPGYCTLAQAIQAYPGGISAESLVWIYRRLLDIIGFAHSKKIIHGAVTPNNILIGQDDIHEVKLINWHNAIINPEEDKKFIPSIENQWKDFYPPEVFEKEIPTYSVDLYMAAMSIKALLLKIQVPLSPETKIASFLISCTSSKPASRPHDAWKLREEFTALTNKIWEKKKYVPFSLSK